MEESKANSAQSPALGTVAIVGGAGAMGRWAVRGIARLGSTERLLIADIDLARAQQVADEVGGPCVAVQLDATDPVALRALFSGSDVVLNTMGPFAKFARPVLEAAIDSGCDYLDIDDDWESTLEAFELQERARAQGCRVVKGIGGSPGISNLAALLIARRLDKVTEILTGWSMRGAVLVDEPQYPASATGAAVEHWLMQISGTIRAWRDGQECDIRPLDPVDLDYPDIGIARARTVGHPEAVTLPRYLPGLQSSTNVMSGPDWLFEHAREVAARYDAGEITLSEGAAELENPQRPEGVSPARDPLGRTWALARGERDGQPLAISVDLSSMPPGMMGGGTGTALAVGLELLRRGEIAEVGIHAPEGAIEPLAFFELFREFVEPSVASAEELLVIREQAGVGSEVTR
jgi:saccharopine dehydrogenase-like NADP-dependent oxidoreductase